MNVNIKSILHIIHFHGDRPNHPLPRPSPHIPAAQFAHQIQTLIVRDTDSQ